MVWIAWAGGLVGLYVLMELTARWWLRRLNAYYVWLPGVRLHLHTDRKALPEFEPLLRIEINSDGERGAQVRGADEGLYRVLAAGGSAVEGHCLDQASNWTAQLERLLGTPEHLSRLGATRVHVGGIGRSAVTAEDVDLTLQRVLPRYRRLDAVLVMIGAGDVVKWLACGAPSNAPAPPGAVPDLFAFHPEGPFGWHPARTALLRVATAWRRRWIPATEVRHGAGKWIVQARAMRAAAQELRTTAGDPTVMLDHFARHLRNGLQRARTRAHRVLLLRTPWFEKEYTPQEAARLWHGAMGHPWTRQHIGVYFAFDVVDGLMAQVDARAVEVARQLGVEHVDLKSRLEPSLNTYYDYTHVTPAGARVVALAVAAALIHHGASAEQRPTAFPERADSSSTYCVTSER